MFDQLPGPYIYGLEVEAPRQKNTWKKKGLLLSNGVFIMLWEDKNVSSYTSKCFSGEQFEHIQKNKTIGWGKGYDGSFDDYQFFNLQNIEVKDFGLHDVWHYENYLIELVKGREFSNKGCKGQMNNPMSVEEMINNRVGY